MKIRLVKHGNLFKPFDYASERFADNQIDGKFFECDISSPRNAKFHRLFFKLLSIAFKHWKPEHIPDCESIRDFEQFREDITILAGFYERVFVLDGSMKIKAKSISFANMDDEEFRVLYDKILTVIIQKVLVGWSIQEIDEEIGRFL